MLKGSHVQGPGLLSFRAFVLFIPYFMSCFLNGSLLLLFQTIFCLCLFVVGPFRGVFMTACHWRVDLSKTPFAAPLDFTTFHMHTCVHIQASPLKAGFFILGCDPWDSSGDNNKHYVREVIFPYVLILIHWIVDNDNTPSYTNSSNLNLDFVLTL